MSGADRELAGAEWVLRAISGPGGLDAVYGAQCTTCEETSGQGADVACSVGAWAVEHTRAHPEHRDYVFITRMRWSVFPAVTPAASTPVRVHVDKPDLVVAPSGFVPPPPRRPAHHAATCAKRHRAISTGPARMKAFIGRFAGLLYLSGVCSALIVYLSVVFFLGKV